MSKSTSGAYIPPTEAAAKFIDSNKALFKSFPAIAPFLLPQASGKFDLNAWRVEMANGLRTKTGFEQHYATLKIAGQLGTYFDSKKAHDTKQKELTLAGDSAGKKAEAAAWKTWKDGFMARNPLVLDFLSQGQARQNARQRTVEQLRAALSTSAIPKGETRDAFTSMLQAWDAHTKFQAEHSGRDDYSKSLRDRETLEFDNFLAKVSAANPNAQGLYNHVFRYLES
jgi:hypothetical protein